MHVEQQAARSAQSAASQETAGMMAFIFIFNNVLSYLISNHGYRHGFELTIGLDLIRRRSNAFLCTL